jgi:RND family efflux transporter MFP subunit
VPIVLVVIFGALLAAGTIPRLAQSRARDAERHASASAPAVFTEPVRRDTASSPFEMPATLMGLHETNIYARTNGFVRRYTVDIGSVVRRGDTLVLLDMPDVREQVLQASAVLEQAEASAALASATLTRWKQLADKGVVTPQEFDEKQAAANVTEANVRAARANVANLREVQRFGALIAPFRGVVTARNIDLGSLVAAGAAVGARPLLTLVQTDTVKVVLSVPQSAAARIHDGMPAQVIVRDLGDSVFKGRITRNAGAIDPVTRTLQTIVQLPNPRGVLMPGMFAQVRLTVPVGAPMLRIPAIALIVRGDGTQVARVVHDTVQLVPVTVGRDFGTAVEVRGDIAAGDQVVVNPPESLVSGMAVRATARGAKGAAKP